MTDQTRNPVDSPQDQEQPSGSTYSFTRDQLQAAGGTAAESVQPTGVDSAAQTQPHAVWEPEATQPQYQVNPAAQQASRPSYAYPAADVDPVPGQGSSGNGKNSGKKSKAPKDRSGLKTFALGFAGAAVACVLALGGSALLGNGVVPVATTVLGGSGSEITAQDTSKTLAEQVSSKCLPSVVSIDVYVKESSLMGQYGGLFGMSGSNSGSSDSLTKSSLGSGVVLSEDGYIITNYHVIEGADALKVTIVSNEYDAELVGSDESSDIAVIKAKGVSGLTPIDIGDSDNLTVGEWVMSIGSPFGLEQSVATGIVSATSRSQIMSAEDGSGEYTIYPNMIQTDAAINPGNSGGALVDSQGRLIGINTMITSYSGNYSGVGFAIPVNYAISLAQQIIEGKTPTHAQLGVTLSSVDQNTASRYGFAVSEGAYISSVSSGSGAEKAGLQVGDIVTKFNDTKISSASDLMLAVRSQKVGSKVTVEFYRDNEVKTAEVTLGSDESSASQKKEESRSDQQDQGQDQGYSRDDLEKLFNRYFGNGYGGQGQQG
ncbi:MAG: trypsin-like peptidase domain-containing protein [Eggerthellales bacterium]|nr:trypsin-like peptidase domain-containing protein [Eggerthellales bacterium]